MFSWTFLFSPHDTNQSGSEVAIFEAGYQSLRYSICHKIFSLKNVQKASVKLLCNMSFTLEDSKLANQKSKDLVFGFIKKAQTLLPSSTSFNIPALIAHVCLVYYYLNEYFDPEYIDTFEFEDKEFEAKDCIVKTNESWCCVYLHTIVSSGKHQ